MTTAVLSGVQRIDTPKALNRRGSLFPLVQMKTSLLTPPSWVEPLTLYLAWLVASAAPATTVKLRGYHLRRFASRTGLAPFQVTLNDLVDYLASEPAWGLSTRRSHRTTLRAFYSWAALVGHMPADPSHGLPRIANPIGKPRPAPESAVKLGLENIDPRSRMMVRLAAQIGLRCCEIAVVSTHDLQEDLVGWSLLVHGKGNKQRVVPLSDELAGAIRRAPAGYLFPGQINGHLSAGHVSKLVSRALPAGVTAHPLRHRFASVAYAGTGGDIRAVQELLGHSSVATTQIYTAVPQGNLRRGVLAAA
jgi:site-specific recombinase XerD